MNTPASTYRLHSVQTATALGQVVMLYDAALARMHSAILAMDARNIELRGTHLNRVLDIVAQLEGTLDFERGGEVAKTLRAFYVNARNAVLRASIENSPERIHALINHWSMVRDAWRQIEHIPPSESVPSTSELPSKAGRGAQEVTPLHFSA